MPQDSTTYIYYDSSFLPASQDNGVVYDSSYEAFLHQKEVSEYYAGRNNNKSDDTYMPFLFLAIFIVAITRIIITSSRQNNDENNEAASGVMDSTNPVLSYNGEDLNFSDDELKVILEKRFIYYTRLPLLKKELFLSRLKAFIKDKTFIIHDESGFKEMPVLISAVAIQVSLGLDKYMLPHFSDIHIFPEEFIGITPVVRLLEGNVAGNCINLSWKHFLHDFQVPDDGQNVGLHEMAHAYYYQNFETNEQVCKDFVKTFKDFTNYGDKVLRQETEPGNDLYTDYGLRNMDEFWAESIELFFEKPISLQSKYPELYTTIKEILKQDPLVDLI